MSVAPTLSARGQRALVRPPLLKYGFLIRHPHPPSSLPGLHSHCTESATSHADDARCALFENQFCPETCSGGMINLGVAENTLCTDWLIQYYAGSFKLELGDFTYGSALAGSHRLFAALDMLYRQHLGAVLPIKREHVIAGNGCGSVIDLLVSCLCDEGEGILVARPFYNGFSASFSGRAGVVPVGVELVEGCEADASAVDAFENRLIESEADGVKIRAVLLCNPNNPLGFCYSRETLIAFMRFAERHNLHIISDEIYALSVFDSPNNPRAIPFTSILSIDPVAVGCSPARVHAIYGASKDWGANGFRVGALISQSNPELHSAMESNALLMKVSSVADRLWSGLLLDEVQLPLYIKMNKQRMSDAYRTATNWLERHEIPFRPANAGHFIVMDLSRFLSYVDNSGRKLSPVEAEEQLANRLMLGGVNVARGAAYSFPTSGWFRLTFTLRSDYFTLGLKRIEVVLGICDVPLRSGKTGIELGEVQEVMERVQRISV